MSTLLSILFVCLQCCIHQMCGCGTAGVQTQSVRQMNTKEMTDEVNSFGFDTYRKVSATKPGDNLFFSPSSLALALAMTAIGAEGLTETDMLATLGLCGFGKSDASGYFNTLILSLKGADDKCSLEIANSIWIHNTISLKESFVDGCRNSFDAYAAVRDFDRKETLNEINAWCAEKTHDKITSILDNLDSSLVMALLNAIYFKGPWGFEWSLTKKGIFHSIDSQDRTTTLMSATDYMPFAENDRFEALELPYGNGSFVLDILLPKDPSGFAASAAGLDGKCWESLEEGFSSEKVAFTIPKFRIEDDMELTDILKDMGMAVAFGKDADFSAMSDTPLKIGIVKQKTFVDVNEKGTEAAAITFIGMKCMALPTSEEKPRHFVADRPFIFLIRERSTGAVLFIGQKTK